MRSLRLSIPLFLVLVMTNIGGDVLSQDTYHAVNGILKDAKTGEKISFASITVPGTGIGTVSNSNGEFILKIDTSLHAEKFEVSHLRYATSAFPIADGPGKNKTYYLNVRPIQLQEITVLPGDARELVELALQRYRENYSDIPNLMTGFYREAIMKNRHYLSVSEAVVDIYKAPYASFQRDQVKIFKGRKGTDVRRSDTLLVELQGGPSVLLLLDIVKNRDLSIAFDDLDNYYFELESVAYIDDQLNWIIGFSPAVVMESPLYFGKIYISQENMAISRFEFSLDLSDQNKAAGNFIKKKPRGLVFRPASTSYLINYKQYEDKYYLNYVRVELKFKCDWKRKLFKKNYTLTSELAITDRKDDDVSRFSTREIFKSNMIFTSEVQDFADKNYWGRNNIIEPEKSIEFAIEKLSKSRKD